MSRRSLSVRQLAQLLGVTEQSASAKLRRGEIVAQREQGRRGDARGTWRIPYDSLPSDLQERADEKWPEIPASPGALKTMPGRRGRDRKPRVQIGRTWDCNIDLAEAEKADIASQLDKKVRSLWASAAQRAGWRTIARYASLDLYDLCRAAGSDLPDETLHSICEVPRRFICNSERRRHRKTDIFRNDHKAFHDTLPSTTRTRSELPFDVLFGDGTSVDTLFLDADGRQVKIGAILWFDDCTGCLFGHFLLRKRGEGVRQEHVALSFAYVCAQMGLPRAVYVDNGGEYGWVELLKHQRLMRVVQALPYSARSKAIEPAIRVFMEQHVALIDGYLGNDRMAKKTQTVGRPTTPYSGDANALLNDLYAALDMYNTAPRAGLGNRSPYQVLQQACDAGWAANTADFATMAEALSKPETRTVKRGTIQIGGTRYSSDVLCEAWDLEGERVTVGVPPVSWTVKG